MVIFQTECLQLRLNACNDKFFIAINFKISCLMCTISFNHLSCFVAIKPSQYQVVTVLATFIEYHSLPVVTYHLWHTNDLRDLCTFPATFHVSI